MRKKLFPDVSHWKYAHTPSTENEKKIPTMNPFFQAYNTPFNVPPFDKTERTF
jgi:peptidyl-dipeptidase Dcp